jgi:AraC-like DNA-binding protein
MITLKLCLIFTLSFMCLFFGMYLLLAISKKKENIFLAIGFIGYAVANAIETLFYFPEIKNQLAPYFGFIFYQKETIELLIIPCLAIYVCKKRFSSTKIWLHFIPVIISFFLSFTYYLINGSTPIINALCHLYIWPVFLSALFIAIQIAQLLFYAYFISQKKVSLITSSFNLLLFKVIFFCKTLYLLDYIIGIYYHLHMPIQVPFYFTYKILFLISLSTLFLMKLKKELLYKAETIIEKKYSRSNLSEQSISEIMINIERYMNIQKPYLEPDFSLEQMAENIGFLRTHISRTINESYQMNFREFINMYRINESIRLMSDDREDYNAINQIYFEAGFNSKSVFNAAFKKQTGITPSEFRKNNCLKVVV